MDSVLLDTDVFSFFFKEHSYRLLYANDIRDRRLCLSFMTYAELTRWTIERNWGDKRKDRLTQVLKEYVILPYDAAMAKEWAKISAHRRRIHKPIDCGDCWIAATALRHDIPLATHNARDYQGIDGLKLITRAEQAKK